MEVFKLLWVLLQVFIGYHLVLPILIFLLSKVKAGPIKLKDLNFIGIPDYAIIVTAYEQTKLLKFVVDSILRSEYNNYVVYIVADKCDISELIFEDDRILVLKPEHTLASNTKSHRYAIERLIREHNIVTIIDSDNLVEVDYLSQLNKFFQAGYTAVQGVRKAKNMNTDIAVLDAARDMYYHFYDGKILFEIGSSATLSGSGMAFERKLYYDFLKNNQVEGAGFDKVLQAWLIMGGRKVAFAEHAVVYDEKTSHTKQLVQQRSRWINTWFKYFKLGFTILAQGAKKGSFNQIMFGLILLRPPLFLFIFFSGVFMILNLFISHLWFLIWVVSFILFIAGFFISLSYSKASGKVYMALVKIPKFIYFQMISLAKSRNANKNSVATVHFHDNYVDKLK